MRAPSVIAGLALFGISAWADSGFYPTRFYRVPSAVEVAGTSVVKIAMYDSRTGRRLGTGSGFVVDDSRTIWTAAHVIVGQQSENLSLRLYDCLGREIFDTNATDTATLTLIGRPDGVSYAIDSKDYAKITLSRPLGLRPIAVNPAPVSMGQELYSVGFPVIESIAPVSSETIVNAILQTRATMGKSIPYAEATASLSIARGPAQSAQAAQAIDKKLIFMDSDGYFGQSGSPILNENGEAVGIFTAIIRTRENGPGVHINTKGLGPSFYGILTPQ